MSVLLRFLLNVRERLTDSERLAIENLVRVKTSVGYFALGETPYERYI